MDAEHPGTGLPEMELLVDCLRPASAVPASSWLLRCEWGRLVQLALEHGVRPQLCQALLRQPDVPQRDVVRQLQHALAAEALLQAAELRRVGECLAAAGVAYLAYKGPVLAVLAHGDVYHREAGDLDLFLPRDALGRAVAALEKAGYASEGKDVPSRHWQRYVAAIGQAPLRHLETGTLVELHVDLLPPAFGFRLPFAQAWERRQVVTVAGAPISTLGDEDTVPLLVAHGSKHLWGCLCWIHDLAKFVRARPRLDWDAVFRLCRQWQGARALHVALLLGRELLDYPPPWPLPEDRRAHSLADWIKGRILAGVTTPPSGLTSAWFQFQGRDGWRTALPWAASLALSPTPADWRHAAGPAWTLPVRRCWRLLAARPRL